MPSIILESVSYFGPFQAVRNATELRVIHKEAGLKLNRSLPDNTPSNHIILRGTGSNDRFNGSATLFIRRSSKG